jgi:excisionase family DNA binding protein
MQIVETNGVENTGTQRASNSIAPRLLDTEAACRVLSIRRSKFYELLADGSLKGVKIGAKRLIPADEIERFVAKLQAA